MKNIGLFILFQLSAMVLLAQNRTQLIVHAPVLEPQDTLELYLQQDRIMEYFFNPSTLIKAPNQDGVFYFDIPNLDKSSWISMNLSFQKRENTAIPFVFGEFLLESGDSVHIYLSPKVGLFGSVEEGFDGNIPMLLENWDAHFSGRGATKFEALWAIKTIGESQNKNKILKSLDSQKTIKPIELLKQLENQCLEALNAYRNQLSVVVYNLLLLQVKGEYSYKLGRAIDGLFYASKDKDWEETVKVELEKYIENVEVDSLLYVTDRAESPKYIDFIKQYTWMKLLKYGSKRDVVKWYEYCRDSIESSKVRDRLMASLLIERFQFNPDRAILDEALTLIKDPYALERVSMLVHNQKGKEAFAFQLPDVYGHYHKMEDFKGKVVFMDFWYAACTPCRKYLLNVVNPVKRHFKDNPNVVFITVSIDNRQTFESMVQRADFLPMGAVHLYTDNLRYKHPIITHYQIRSYPFPLLIDSGGLLVGGKSILKTSKDVIAAIESILVN